MKKLLELLFNNRRHHGVRQPVNINESLRDYDHNHNDNDDRTACESKSSHTSPTQHVEDDLEEEDEEDEAAIPRAFKLDSHPPDDHYRPSKHHKQAVPAVATATTACTVSATAATTTFVPVDPPSGKRSTRRRKCNNMIDMNVLYDCQKNDDNDDDDDDDDKDTAKDDDSTTAIADESRTSSICSSSSLSKKLKGEAQLEAFRRGLARRRRQQRQQPPPPPQSPPSFTNHHHHSPTTTSTRTSPSLAMERAKKRRALTNNTIGNEAKTFPATATKAAGPSLRLPLWASRLALRTLAATPSCSPSSGRSSSGLLPVENVHAIPGEEIRKRSVFLLLCFVMNALAIMRACLYHRVFGGYHHSSNNVFLFPLALFMLFGVDFTLLIISLTTKQQHNFNYHSFVRNQLVLVVVFPCLEHFYLGGWQTSGAVVLWSFLAPMLAAFFQSSQASKAWFQYVLVCIVPLIMYEVFVVQHHQQPTATSTTAMMSLMSNINLLGTMSILFATAQFGSKTIENSQRRLQEVVQQFLPSQVAASMLQQQHHHQPQQDMRPLLRHHDQVSLLSIRVVGDDKDSAWLLTDFLQEFFNGIDQSVQQHQRPTPLTKVKTMGNVYLIAGGLEEAPEDTHSSNGDGQHQQQGLNVDDYSTTASITTMTTCSTASENHHTAQLLRLGAELFPLLDDINSRLGTTFEIRIGLHVGSVVAGVLMNNTQQQQRQRQHPHHHYHHQQLLSYDVWGHAVDVVQDLQLQCLSACGGLVHLSQDAYDKVRHLQDLYLFASRSGSDSKSAAVGKAKKTNARTYFCKPKLLTSSSICSIGNYINPTPP